MVTKSEDTADIEVRLDIGGQLIQVLEKVWAVPGGAEVLALLGGLVYVLQALANAQTRASFLDEGLYLYKGFLFASGRYYPFQDFGPWTNQMPLAFLIPGFIQVWFGPGLREGRYFGILLAMVMLMGLWLVTRRLAGRWWATGVVWAIALNVAGIKLYTLAITQGLVACLLVWVIALSLGEKRLIWQLGLGAALASLLIFVRINMAPVLPLLLVYISWQHGWKKAAWALFSGASVFILVHLLYWPGILKMWTPWLPGSITPWLEEFRLSVPAEGWRVNAALPDLIEKTLYFFLSIRLHLLSLGGALITWLLWPGSSRRWKTVSQFKSAVFLSVTLLVLFLMHLWASFGLGYCLSCILLYVSFFDFMGLILLASSFSALKRQLPLWRELLVLLVVLVLALGVGYSLFSDIGRPVLSVVVSFISPGLKDLALWGQLSRLLGISRFNLLRVLFSLAGGLILGILLVLMTRWVHTFLNRNRTQPIGVSFVLLNGILIFGLFFSPTVLLSKGNDFFACGGDVLKAFENTGKYLQQDIPDSSQVFWMGRLPALFLYIPDANVYPPLLNHYHNFRYGGDDQELYRFGLWNQSLGTKWISESDFILVEEEWLDGWVKDEIEAKQMQELSALPLPIPCRESSRIHVYANPQR